MSVDGQPITVPYRPAIEESYRLANPPVRCLGDRDAMALINRHLFDVVGLGLIQSHYEGHHQSSPSRFVW